MPVSPTKWCESHVPPFEPEAKNDLLDYKRGCVYGFIRSTCFLGGAMAIHYYLSAFPMEALIASELEPKQFGSYMATGSKKGSDELIIFAEIEGDCTPEFDWNYAKEKCIPHPNGDPKHSVYLSVYRTLEYTPLKAFGSLFLTTRDGRSLELTPDANARDPSGRDYYLYQELCPIKPLIVSRLDPEKFASYMTNQKNHVYTPKLIFSNLKTPNFEDPENTGHTGGFLFNKKGHFLSCIASISDPQGKANKTFDRSHVESFSFQTIEDAVYVGDGTELLIYPMPSVDEIKKIDYDWGRSALLY